SSTPAADVLMLNLRMLMRMPSVVTPGRAYAHCSAGGVSALLRAQQRNSSQRRDFTSTYRTVAFLKFRSTNSSQRSSAVRQHMATLLSLEYIRWNTPSKAG